MILDLEICILWNRKFKDEGVKNLVKGIQASFLDLKKLFLGFRSFFWKFFAVLVKFGVDFCKQLALDSAHFDDDYGWSPSFPRPRRFSHKSGVSIGLCGVILVSEKAAFGFLELLSQQQEWSIHWEDV